jgi:hypothetical protein
VVRICRQKVCRCALSGSSKGSLDAPGANHAHLLSFLAHLPILTVTAAFSSVGWSRGRSSWSHLLAVEVCCSRVLSLAFLTASLCSLGAAVYSPHLSDRLCEWVNSSGKFPTGPSNDAILKVCFPSAPMYVCVCE